MELPFPCGSESLVKLPLCMPAEFGICERSISPDGFDVACPAGSDTVIQFEIVDSFECPYHFQYRYTLSGPDVEYLVV